MKAFNFLLKLGFVAMLLIGLSGCSDKPPKYDGEKAKAYGEKVGSYYGDKLKDAGAENIRQYISESKKLVNNLHQNIKILDKNQAVEKVDNTIEQLIDLSDKYLNISEDDYKFFANPLKYYDLYDDYDNFTQAAIGNSGPQMWSQMAYVVGMSYGGKLYSPFDIDLKDILKNQDKKYYYVLKHTKYKLFLNDNNWLKSYEAKKNILDTAIQITKKEKLYFDIKLNGFGKLKDNSYEIKNLLKEKDFKVINNADVLGQTYGKNIFEFEKMVKSKNKDNFKQKYRYIQYAKRDLVNAKKRLAEKEKYLKQHPDSKWAKDDVNRYKKDIEKYTQKFKEAEEKFDKLYQSDIKKLNQQVEKLNKLLKEKEVAQKHLQHNIRVFVKTFKTLLQQGYKDYEISKYITNNGHRAYKKDILSIDINQQNIKLDHLTGMAFDDYIKNMQKVLNK